MAARRSPEAKRETARSRCWTQGAAFADVTGGAAAGASGPDPTATGTPATSGVLPATAEGGGAAASAAVATATSGAATATAAGEGATEGGAVSVGRGDAGGGVVGAIAAGSDPAPPRVAEPAPPPMR